MDVTPKQKSQLSISSINNYEIISQPKYVEDEIIHIDNVDHNLNGSYKVVEFIPYILPPNLYDSVTPWKYKLQLHNESDKNNTSTFEVDGYIVDKSSNNMQGGRKSNTKTQAKKTTPRTQAKKTTPRTQAKKATLKTQAKKTTPRTQAKKATPKTQAKKTTLKHV